MTSYVDNWKSPEFRQSVVLVLEKTVQRSGVQIARSCNEMENHVFVKAKIREEYMNLVAKLIFHIREMSSGQLIPKQEASNMENPNENAQSQPPGNNQPGIASSLDFERNIEGELLSRTRDLKIE